MRTAPTGKATLFASLPLVALLGMACGASSGGPAVDAHPLRDLGAIAYVDAAGCIAVTDVESGEPAAETFCPESRGGVSALAWIDADRVAYATRESTALGWRVIDVRSNAEAALPGLEGPRVVHAGPVQPYSIHGELLSVDDAGTVSVEAGAEAWPILDAAPAEGDKTLPQLLTWSPDGQWALLKHGQGESLLALGRDGREVREVAPQSRGLATWFMPGAGVMPHMDFTCGLPTAGTFSCSPELREPVVSGAEGGGVVLTWLTCGGATGYELALFSPGASEPIFSRVVSVPAYRLTEAALAEMPDGELTWRVRPLIGDERGVWSAQGVLP